MQNFILSKMEIVNMSETKEVMTLKFLLKNTSEELPFLKNIQLENKEDLMTVDLKMGYTTV